MITAPFWGVSGRATGGMDLLVRRPALLLVFLQARWQQKLVGEKKEPGRVGGDPGLSPLFGKLEDGKKPSPSLQWAARDFQTAQWRWVEISGFFLLLGKLANRLMGGGRSQAFPPAVGEQGKNPVPTLHQAACNCQTARWRWVAGRSQAFPCSPVSQRVGK